MESLWIFQSLMIITTAPGNMLQSKTRRYYRVQTIHTYGIRSPLERVGLAKREQVTVDLGIHNIKLNKVNSGHQSKRKESASRPLNFHKS